MSAHEARKLAKDVFLKTLPHLDAGAKMREMVRRRDGALEIAGDRIALQAGRPVRVIVLGKAAVEMTRALAEILEGVPLRGVVAAPSVPLRPLPGFEFFAGGHPYPNEQSWQAAQAMLTLLNRQGAEHDDVVIFLISGGGSALAELPLDASYAVADWQRFYQRLVICGASIQEMNTVRKHFSAIKGGRLAEAAEGARQITLYVSDVPDYLPSMIASGPSMPDESTLADCSAVLSRYRLIEEFPPIFQPLGRSAREPILGLPDTPKAHHPCFSRSLYYCLLSNSDGLDKLAALLEQHGFETETDASCDDWEFGKAADHLLARLDQMRAENPGRPVAVISGGELSCPVTGDGIGGRNQAFVLDCAQKIAGQPIVVLSAGTDGLDGNSPAAGAVADGETLARARALGMDAAEYQRRSDSFHFFEKLGDAILTGPTGTNVRDLRVLLAY